MNSLKVKAEILKIISRKKGSFYSFDKNSHLVKLLNNNKEVLNKLKVFDGRFKLIDGYDKNLNLCKLYIICLCM